MTAQHFSLCRMAGDETRACPFVGLCHETRQRVAHYAPGGSLRGNACWAYQAYSESHPEMLAIGASDRDLA